MRCSSWIAVLLSAVCFATAAEAESPEPRMIGVEPVAAVNPSAPAGNAGLFVGVNDFEDKNINSLRYAVNDAVALAHFFVVDLKLVTPTRCALVLSGKPQGDEQAML